MQTRIYRRERYPHDQSAPGSLALRRDERQKAGSRLPEKILPRLRKRSRLRRSSVCRKRERACNLHHIGEGQDTYGKYRVPPISASPFPPPQCCHRPLARYLVHRQKCLLNPKGLSRDALAQHLGLAHPHRCPLKSRMAVPGCAVLSKTGFTTTLPWLCAAALILTKTAKLTARADFVTLDLLSDTVLFVER